MQYAKYLIAAIVTAAVFYGGILLAHQTSTKYGDINGGVNYLSTMSVSKSVTVGPQVSVQVLATSTARTYASLSNGGSTNITCSLSDASTTASNSGVSVVSGQPYTITSGDLYIGSIQCSATASTTLYVVASQ